MSPLDGVNGVRRNLLARIMTLVGAIMAPRRTYIEPSIAFNATISFEVVVMALLGGAHRKSRVVAIWIVATSNRSPHHSATAKQ